MIAGIGAAAIAAASVVGINVASSQSKSVGGASLGFGAPGGRFGAAPGGGAGGQARVGGPPGFGGSAGSGTFGTIAALNDTSVTITTMNGATVKVVTTASTSVDMSTSATLGDIKTGDHVVVLGAKSGKTITSQRITDTGAIAASGPGSAGAPGSRLPGAQPGGVDLGVVVGTIALTNGSSLTIAGNDGATWTATTSTATRLTAQRVATLRDLSTGEQVSVEGMTATDGTITATAISAGSQP